MSAPEVVIYTDGGADPNPGAGGWGAVLRHLASGKTRELHGGEAHTTNNRMELTAAIRALEALERRCEVELWTDSQYLKRGITEWLPGWIARGFARKGGELQNADLWRRLAELGEQHAVRWHWLRGHTGNRWNERADALATRGIREQKKTRRETDRPAYEIVLKVAGGAWAASVRPPDGSERILTGTAENATANELDLLGAVAALAETPAGSEITVRTASDYLANGASRWLAGWERRGYRTASGGPVKNDALWRRIAVLQSARRVRWARPDETDAAVIARLTRATRGVEDEG